MVSLFENYEQQYSVLTADITAQIGLLSTSATSKLILLSTAYVNKNGNVHLFFKKTAAN